MKRDSRSAIRIREPQLNIMTKCMTVSGRKEKAINPRHTQRGRWEMTKHGMFLFLPSHVHTSSHTALFESLCILRSHTVSRAHLKCLVVKVTELVIQISQTPFLFHFSINKHRSGQCSDGLTDLCCVWRSRWSVPPCRRQHADSSNGLWAAPSLEQNRQQWVKPAGRRPPRKQRGRVSCLRGSVSGEFWALGNSGHRMAWLIFSPILHYY